MSRTNWPYEHKIGTTTTDRHTINTERSKVMRRFLLTLFWFCTFANVVQLLVMTSAGWFIISGNYSFANLSLDVFVTEIAPWLLWMKTILVALLGDFGRWVLSVPVFIISPIKFVAGIIIGWWAYSAAKKIPLEPAALVKRQSDHPNVCSKT